MINRSGIINDDHTISALLEFNGIGAAVAWYKNVLGAEENMRLVNANEKVTYAELSIGDSMLFLKEENFQSPQLTDRRSKELHVYVGNVDKAIKMALQNDATLVMSPEELHGDRCGCILDPFGYTWVLTSYFRDDLQNEIPNKKDGMAHA